MIRATKRCLDKVSTSFICVVCLIMISFIQLLSGIKRGQTNTNDSAISFRGHSHRGDFLIRSTSEKSEALDQENHLMRTYF